MAGPKKGFPPALVIVRFQRVQEELAAEMQLVDSPTLLFEIYGLL